MILEGGPIPPNEPVPPEHPPPDTQQSQPDLYEEILYFRRRLGKDDFDRMWALFEAINRGNREFDQVKAQASVPDQQRPADDPARAAPG